MLQTRVNSGLDGVIVADTAMSEVDGEAGRLIVRGHAIEELVATRGFEGVAALLWEGFAEGGGDERAVRAGFAAARQRAFAEVPRLLPPPKGLTSGRSAARRHRHAARHARRCRTTISSAARMPVFLAAPARRRKGQRRRWPPNRR